MSAKTMTEDEIMEEVNWSLHYDPIENGPCSKVCHYEFWGLMLEKLVRERKAMTEELETLRKQLGLNEE